jgi:long-chain acyl-CoA synthetase
MDAELEYNLINRVAAGDLLRRRARDSASATAIVDYTSPVRERMTFSALNERANKFGRAFRRQGARKGDRICILTPNCNDIAAAMYGCFKAGMIYVPLNYMMSEGDLSYVVNHAEPVCAIVHPTLVEFWLKVLPNLKVQPKTFVLGEAPQAQLPALEPLLREASGAEILDVVINDRDPAQILYTSGTTSRPKGVVQMHLNLVMASMSMALIFHLARGDSYVSPLPLFHVAAQGHMLMTHQVGGKFIVSNFQAAAFADLIEQEEVNGIFLLPMMWKAMLELPGVDTRDFSSVKHALYAMAPMSADILQPLRELFGCDFNQTSGQTECSVVTKYYDKSPVEFPGGNYWGRPTPMCDQAVLDDEGRELPQGEVGEICWRSPTIMAEYYRDEAATRDARKFGWHHSGDLGKIDEYGQLLFVDRKKDMVKSGGENVSSVRVEQVISGIPGVTAAAVIGLPHPKWGEAVSAFVVLRPDVSLSADAILAQCKEKLSRFEVPKHIEIIESLPATPTGKIQKHELRKRFASLFTQ